MMTASTVYIQERHPAVGKGLEVHRILQAICHTNTK